VNSLLEQLGNEAILMMYLAEELPPEDAVEVRQLLDSDTNLRAQLEALRAAQSEFLYGMAVLDAVETPPLAAPNATRDALRAINRWRELEALRKPIPQPSPRQLRYPWWTYPMATAAAILIAFLAWWGNTPTMPDGNDAHQGTQTAMVNGADSPMPVMPGEDPGNLRGFRSGRFAMVMETWRPLVPDEPHLAQAEEQLAALSQISDSSGLFPPDMN